MEITLNTHYGYTIEINAENVHLSEDIEKRIYSKTEDGKIDKTKRPERDIDDGAMDQIMNLLCDMAYWRKAEYDSTLLIEYLFEKLPEDKAIALMGYLVSQYGQPEAEKSNNQEYRGFKIQPSDYGPGYFEASHPDHEDCLWAKSLEALKIEIDELIEERDAQLGRKEESNANS